MMNLVEKVKKSTRELLVERVKLLEEWTGLTLEVEFLGAPSRPRIFNVVGEEKYVQELSPRCSVSEMADWIDAFRLGFDKGYLRGFEKGVKEGTESGLEKGKMIGEDNIRRTLAL